MSPLSSAPSSSSSSLPIVLVTGASGFVGIHCVQQLLLGPYRVRGTVRDKENKQKVGPLLSLKNSDKLELVEADLLKDEHWPSVVEGCSYIFHVASPVPVVPDQSTITTAVNGTLNVLKAAASSQVRKVVLTGSCVAINDGHKRKGKVFNEEYWTDLDSNRIDDYARSKTMAEQQAWHFWRNIPDGSAKFALTVLHPTLIIGPVLSAVECGSTLLVSRMMSYKTYPAAPKAFVGIVDVRDVALAHIRSIESSSSDGHRILLTNDPTISLPTLTKWLSDEFKKMGYPISNVVAPNWVLRVYARLGIDDQAKAVVHRIGDPLLFDNTKSRHLLGMQYRDPHKALLQMAHSMVDNGMIKKTKKYSTGRMEDVLHTLTTA